MRRGDLFVLSWDSLRRVEWGKVSSFLSMSGGGLFNSLLVCIYWSVLVVCYLGGLELLRCEWFSCFVLLCSHLLHVLGLGLCLECIGCC